MKKTIGIITPVVGGQDLSGAEREFLLLTKDKNRKMSLKSFHELSENGFNAKKLEKVKTLHGSNVPAAGYYLTGVLRQSGFNTILSNKYNDETLKMMAKEDPMAICISTTMVFSRKALKAIINSIRRIMPDVMIIVGGVFLWKSFVFLNDKNRYEISELSTNEDLNMYLALPCTKDEIDADVMIVSPHGVPSLIEVVKTIEKGGKKDFSSIPNLAIPNNDGEFICTHRVNEEIDYNNDFTRWDLIDELPSRIPIRTSVGCPYRCGFCDFYQLYPKVFMRSKESLMKELKLLKDLLGSNVYNSLLDVTDDNVFITPQRVNEFCTVLQESKIRIGWTGFLRSSSVNKNNIDTIKRSNLLSCLIGVESGDNDQLVRMKKMQTAQQQKEGIELLDKAGISSVLSFVIGYPGETEKTIENTANFLNSLHTNLASFNMFSLIVMPFASIATAELRQEYKLKGLWHDWKHYTMSSEEVGHHCYSLYKQVTEVPYTHTEEDLFFNMTKLKADQRKNLYILRKKLTEQYIDKREWNEMEKTYEEIYQAMGVGQVKIPESLKDDIYCPVSF